MGLVLHKSPAHVGLSCVPFLDHSYLHHPKGSVMGSGQAPKAHCTPGCTLPVTKHHPSPCCTWRLAARPYGAPVLLVSCGQPLLLVLAFVFTLEWLGQPPFLFHELPA